MIFKLLFCCWVKTFVGVLMWVCLLYVCRDIFLVIIFIGVSLRVSTYVWLHFVLILPLRPRFSFVLHACVCNAYRRDSSKKIVHVCEYAWSILWAWLLAIFLVFVILAPTGGKSTPSTTTTNTDSPTLKHINMWTNTATQVYKYILYMYRLVYKLRFCICIYWWVKSLS